MGRLVESELRNQKTAEGDSMGVAGVVTRNQLPRSIHLHGAAGHASKRWRQGTQLAESQIHEFLAVAVADDHLVQCSAETAVGTRSQDGWPQAIRRGSDQCGLDTGMICR